MAMAGRVCQAALRAHEAPRVPAGCCCRRHVGLQKGGEQGRISLTLTGLEKHFTLKNLTTRQN